MPNVFRYGSYVIYIWTNENRPLEPVHVHIAVKKPRANATKVWINADGSCTLENNNSRIPEKDLKRLLEFIQVNSTWILKKWERIFGEKPTFR